jgi:hypothetical protein
MHALVAIQCGFANRSASIRIPASRRRGDLGSRFGNRGEREASMFPAIGPRAEFVDDPQALVGGTKVAIRRTHTRARRDVARRPLGFFNPPSFEEAGAAMTEKTMTTPMTGVSSTSNPDQAALALKSNVIDGARELTDEMKHLAGDVASEAKKTAESGISAGKKRAADGLVGVANAIRKTGEHLRAEDQGAFTEYFDRAARQVDVASEYLQRRTLGQVIGDVEQFARREPALFLGGAFVAGLVGGRFLKSSRPAPSSQAHSGGHGAGARHGSQDAGRADGHRQGAESDAPGQKAPNDRDRQHKSATRRGQEPFSDGDRAQETDSPTTHTGGDDHRSGNPTAKAKLSTDSSAKPRSGAEGRSPKTSGAT